MTRVIAHRGASRNAPENTPAAFQLAVEQRADMIETDLHLCRDGSVPLYHDNELEGRPLRDWTLAELRLRLPDVPTLEETLDRFGDAIPFNLELKTHPAHAYPGLEERVLAEVRKRGLLERTLFSCFFDPALARLRELAPDARIGLLISRRSNANIVERAASLGAEAVHPELAITTPELIEELHNAGLSVNVFTVDDPRDQRRLIDQGVAGIFTNLPGKLRELLAD